MNTGETEIRTEGADTVFGWGRNRRTWVYLGGFLFFSTVIHGAGFYLFQVVYPTPSRIEPDRGKIAFLDPVDPAVRSLLQRLEDRSVYVLPASHRTNVRVELEEARIPFSPSFGKAPLELVSPDYPWSLPFAGLGQSAEPAVVEPLPGRVVVELEGDLNDREKAPWSILDDYLNRAESVPELRVRLEVDPAGMVSVKAVEGEIAEESQGDLVQVIESTLRFLPSDGPSRGWIRISATSPNGR